MKPMTFEEWLFQNKLDYSWRDSASDVICREWFNTARLGMIPEDEAVRIPPVEEWPEHANGVLIGYDANGRGGKEKSVFDVIKYIPRPVPAWTPKVGDRVFGKVGEHQVIVGMVSEIPEHCRWIAVTQGSFVAPFDKGNLKPFSPEKIGLKWEEI